MEWIQNHKSKKNQFLKMADSLLPPPPQGRNEKCRCQSGKKYKVCCGNIAQKELILAKHNDSGIHTAGMNIVLYYLRQAFPDHVIKDMTDIIHEENYVNVLRYHFPPRFILVMERSPFSETLFAQKTATSANPADNILMMHMGKYLTFSSNHAEQSISQIAEAKWIQSPKTR